ncbi:MAG: methylmalonyl-CoA mutase [Candidatus Lokiarchaeota archaeon]|nr:methylmalonyl-CoA mutase [Candidatus Lokiarchaeota archaeon]MBD3201877.1 methylmalonyl-CoA mutase [Candidatus Lokiarchaeota archaeon]
MTESKQKENVEVKKDKKGRTFRNLSDIKIKQLYQPSEISDLDYERDLGQPGKFPFTRGPYSNMYRGRLWTMRQFAGFGTAEQTNERFKFLIDHGQTGLSVAFHLPTIYGYESTDERSLGEVGKEGVAIDTLADMETLFDGIDLSKISTSMTINAPASILLAMYIVVAEKQGISSDKLRGTIQNDILKEYIAQKSWIFPPEPSMRLIVDTIEYCTENVPQWYTISISGYHIREAGSTAVQELAFTLADGFAYVKAAMERGLDVDDFAHRLSFFFNAHNNFFEEICKYRAARRIWARHMKNKYGAKKPESMRLRFHTQTAGVSLTAQEPENNIVRVTLQGLAAVLGGTQSLHTNSFDEALCLPTEKAVRIALRTQQIIAYESGAADTVDPLAGSYYVEWLTDKMEQEAENYFSRIEELGGVIPAIKANFFQKEIANASYKYQKEVENRERIVVGVNKYKPEREVEPDILKIDDAVSEEQKRNLVDIKSKRDNKEAEKTLAELKEAAKGTDNLMPYILEAVRKYCSVGEIIGTLKEIFGTYTEDSIY